MGGPSKIGKKAMDGIRAKAARLASLVGASGRARGDEELGLLRRRIREKDETIERLRRQVAERDRELRAGPDGGGFVGVRPENLTWIFAHQRTGSTWLSSLMGTAEDAPVWREPCVGDLFGSFYYVYSREKQLGSREFIMGRPRERLLGLIRAFVLGWLRDRFPEAEGNLVVKEPHGSIGAPLLMEALPESRMVLLVRDPRDVVASVLDAYVEGGWGHEHLRDDPRQGAHYGRADVVRASEDPDALVRSRAELYLRNLGRAREAYDAHRGPKTLVRYEDLAADTLGTLRRVYSDLGIPVGEVELARAVEEHAWENVPEQSKGGGKFYRKATPGGWREDLTPEQVEIVEEAAAPLLRAFYPD